MSDLIICDIQPQYQQCIKTFELSDFGNHIQKFDNILYFYNGAETIGGEDRQDLIYWLYDSCGINDEDALDEFVSKTEFVDKGYGYFRSYLDQGYSDEDVTDLVKYMLANDINGAQDVPDEVMDSIGLPYDKYNEFVLPGTFDENTFKPYENPEVIGGGRSECLRELLIYFDACEYLYNVNDKFVY